MFEGPHAEANMSKLTDIVWPATAAVIHASFAAQVAAAPPASATHAPLLAALQDGTAAAALADCPPGEVPHSLLPLLPPSAQVALSQEDAALEPAPPLVTPHGATLALEAAVLLQAGWDTAADTVWATTVPEAVAVRRIMARNALPQPAAAARVAAQRAAWASAPGAVRCWIDTDGPKTATRSTVAALWLRHLAER